MGKSFLREMCRARLFHAHLYKASTNPLQYYHAQTYEILTRTTDTQKRERKWQYNAGMPNTLSDLYINNNVYRIKYMMECETHTHTWITLVDRKCTILYLYTWDKQRVQTQWEYQVVIASVCVVKLHHIGRLFQCCPIHSFITVSFNDFDHYYSYMSI